MNRSTTRRVLAVTALATLLGGAALAPAVAAKKDAPAKTIKTAANGKGGPATTATKGSTKGSTKGGPKGATTTPTVGDPALAHAALCAKVMLYPSCTSMTVTVANFGTNGWLGSAKPSENSVNYNTTYTPSQAGWEAVVAHEVGGHTDTWNEIVAKVGVAQAWVDYYDVDYFGEQWLEARYLAVKGVARDFTRTEGKEGYLDCRGPVKHGYTGGYLTMWGVGDLAAQRSFCTGYEAVMTKALTGSRPA